MWKGQKSSCLCLWQLSACQGIMKVDAEGHASVSRGAADLAELFGTTSCQLQSELIHSCCSEPCQRLCLSSPAQPCLCCCCCHPQQDLGATGVLVRNIAGIQFAKQVLEIFPPTRLERPLEMSALGVVQSSPPHTPLVLWFYIAAGAGPPWSGGRESCSQQKGMLFPAVSACLGIGFHLGDVMKEIL